MDTWYWILEYGKVFIGYFFLMFLWPSVVFYDHLRKKTKTYRFSFCVTVQVVIINTVVLLLGFFHILNQTLVIAIFYGVFFLVLLKKIIYYFQLVNLEKLKIYRLSDVRIRVKEFLWELWHSVRPVFYRYSLLFLVIVFGMIYFSYGAFQVHSYGFGDLYVHHQWIYGLTEGKIFYEGVYPEAMHCFIYCLNILFGIRIYSCLLFLQAIHVVVFLLSAFILLREVFYSQYTSILVLTLFLVLDLINADQINSMSRLQITLPQEFGLHTSFLCALYLICYLKNTHHVFWKEKLSKYCWDENLFLFMMSLAASIMIHFHTVIMAFIVCASFAVFALKKIFCPQYLVPLLIAILCGGMIAITPMAFALASGIPFNYSINWAMNAISGEESRDLRNQQDDKLDTRSIDIRLTDVLKGSYKDGYIALYGNGRARWILILTGLSILFCWSVRRRPILGYMNEVCNGYPPVILGSFMYILVYAAPMIGLPDLIPEGRFFAPGHMMLLAVMVIPVDIIFSILELFCKDFLLYILSFLSAAGIYGITVISGNYHGFLFYQLTRYNSVVSVTDSIIETFPQHSYTIVSPTDELYPVIQYGWHEELLTFVENCSNKNYTLPSEYVFIYVEKKPLWYAQSLFFEGYSWLGQEKYLEPYWEVYSKRYPNSSASQSPQIQSSVISEGEAEKNLPQYSNPWEVYSNLKNRTILESKAYEWCQRFSELYPHEMDIYYEDEDFVCYYFKQDTESLYNLGIE